MPAVRSSPASASPDTQLLGGLRQRQQYADPCSGGEAHAEQQPVEKEVDRDGDEQTRRDSRGTTANTTPAARWRTWPRSRARRGKYTPMPAPTTVNTTGMIA